MMMKEIIKNEGQNQGSYELYALKELLVFLTLHYSETKGNLLKIYDIEYNPRYNSYTYIYEYGIMNLQEFKSYLEANRTSLMADMAKDFI